VASLLEVQGVSKRFGGLYALRNVTISVDAGCVFGLIGPNGAGKTTLLNCIAGVHAPDAGEILFGGVRVTGQPPHVVCKFGIARTFQIVKPFPKLTVLQNVMVGALFGRNRYTPREADHLAREMLEFVEFDLPVDAPAESLNTVQLKRMELARALATGCRLILLDEFAAGLTPAELERSGDLIRRIRSKGVTVVMVEHLMKLIMAVCDQIAVLHFGELISQGSPEKVATDPKVIDAYLGERQQMDVP